MKTPLPAARLVLAAVVDAVAEATVLPSFTRIGFGLRRRLEGWNEPSSMRDQVVVVTGASSGIGLAAAVAMARLGAAVHLVGRDHERGARALAAVQAAGPGPALLDLVDLSDADAVVALGLRIAERYERLNALVHSAGALAYLPDDAGRDGADRRDPGSRPLHTDGRAGAFALEQLPRHRGDRQLGRHVHPAIRPRRSRDER